MALNTTFFGAIAIAGAISWYTFNVARVCWRRGHKSAAYWVGFLAVATFAISVGTVLWTQFLVSY